MKKNTEVKTIKIGLYDIAILGLSAVAIVFSLIFGYLFLLLLGIVVFIYEIGYLKKKTR